MNPLVIATLGALAVVGLSNLITKQNADGSTDILQGSKLLTTVPNPSSLIPQNLIQQTIETPLKNVKIIFKRLTCPTTKGEPQIRVTQSGTGTRLYALDFVADATFQLTGQLEVTLNGSTIIQTDAGDFTDADLSVPIPKEGIEIISNQSLSINAFDSGAGNVTCLILTGIK